MYQSASYLNAKYVVWCLFSRFRLSLQLASLQQACVSRVLCWFDETFGPTRVSSTT